MFNLYNYICVYSCMCQSCLAVAVKYELFDFHKFTETYIQHLLYWRIRNNVLINTTVHESRTMVLRTSCRFVNSKQKRKYINIHLLFLVQLPLHLVSTRAELPICRIPTKKIGVKVTFVVPRVLRVTLL